MNIRTISGILSALIIALFLFFMIFEFSGDLEVGNQAGGVATNDCTIKYHEPSGRNIVLRIDDVQAYFNRDIELKMLDEVLKRNITASLAVIPVGLLDDKEVENYLIMHKCDFEIALHGYNNTDFEFQSLNYYEAKEKIDGGLDVLNSLGTKVITFIPPNNEISPDARQAVYDSGIKIISSGFKNKEFGFSTSTYDWGKGTFADYRNILLDCEKEFDKNETCVIMIHPQDYTTDGRFDSEKYGGYLNLLDGIFEMNATVVNFRDLYYDENGFIILKS